MYKKTIVIKILILLLIIIASFIRPISMGKYTVSSRITVSESLQSTQAATRGTTKYMVATYRLPHRKCC